MVEVEREYLNYLHNQIIELEVRNKQLEFILTTREIKSAKTYEHRLKYDKKVSDWYNKYLETGLPIFNLKDDTIEGEVWVEVLNNKGYYISNKGRVKSNNHNSNIKNYILTQSINRFGYCRIRLQPNALFVHRLVASHFIRNEYNKPDVNHKNGNKKDNAVENLEWATESENIQHAFRTGLHKSKSGENHNRAKLSNEDVYKIRELLKLKIKQRDIAMQFNITQTTINNINLGKIWKHLK